MGDAGRNQPNTCGEALGSIVEWGTGRRPKRRLLVNVAAVADADNEYDKLLILDAVNDSVNPHATAPQI